MKGTLGMSTEQIEFIAKELERLHLILTEKGMESGVSINRQFAREQLRKLHDVSFLNTQIVIKPQGEL